MKLLLISALVTSVLSANTFAESATQFQQNKDTISKLLALPGKPNTTTPISGMSAVLYYDQNGVAKTIVLSDGSSVSVTDFLNSKDYSDFIGANSEASSSERSEDSYTDGRPNLVPDNFNGEVNITQNKDSNGNYNVLEGTSNVQGGPFNRAYNGISGSVPSDPPLSDLEYNEKQIILTAQIWGITEIGEKMCRPLDKDFPKSLSSWWLVVKNYMEAEKKRSALEKVRSESLKNTSTQLTTNAGGNSAIQLEGLKIQIESINIAIDSLSGSSLYSGDNKAGDARATSRLAWREALLMAAYQGVADCKTEDAKVVKADAQCNEGIDKSLSVAVKACERKKTIDCSNSSDSQCQGKTGSIEVSDPVPGSCEMVNNYLPNLTKGSMKDLATLYGISPIPSKEMNLRLFNIATTIKNDVVTNFPKSNDSKFDWTTPLSPCSEPLQKPLKLNGVMCPANASEKDYDKTKFEKLGQASDSNLKTAVSSLFVAPAKDVSANAKLFLAAMGITESSLDDSVKLFTGYWNIDDLYMGQSNIRQTYFKYNQKILSDLILADRNKLALLLADRQKLLDMYDKLKKALEGTKAAPGSSSNSGSSLASSKLGTSSSTGSNTDIEPGKDLGKLNIPNSSFDNIGSYNPSKLLSLSKDSNGLLVLSDRNATGTIGAAGASESYSIGTNKKIANSKSSAGKTQKIIDDTNKKSKNMKSADESKSQLAMTNLSNKNMRPDFISSNPILLAAIGGLPVKPGETLQRSNSENSLATSTSSSDLYQSGSSSEGSSSGSSHSGNGKNSNSDTNYNNANNGSNPISGKDIDWGVKDESQKINELIYAKSKENKSKYDPKASDTLFDQITKAHIRNLEKLQN